MIFYAAVARTLGVLAIVAVAVAIVLVFALVRPAGRAWLRATFSDRERHPIGWAWVAVLLATAGSLYFSEVMGFIPCLLCWYQRIAMYPLLLVLGVGVLRGDPGVWRYALPLSLIGLSVSAYHVALQYQPSLEIVPCTTGVPCTMRYVAVFGFISIPAMAGAVFMMVSALLLAVRVAAHSPEAAAGA